MRLPEDIHEIILARLTGDVAPEQEGRLQSWLDEDERNREEYREFCSSWYSGRWGSKREGVSRSVGWDKVTRLGRRRERRRMLRWGAVAASLVVVVGLFWLYRSQTEVVPVAGNVSVVKEGVTLVLSTGEELSLENGNKGEIRENGSVIRSDSAYLEYQGHKGGSPAGGMVYNELIVPKCGEYRLRLADGSLVVLNAESRLRYPVNFTGMVREVYLEGEACFEVAKDALKPFVVHTTKTDVRVLGTLFNVCAYANEDCTEVTLVNGAVQVSAGAVRERLMPDQQLTIDHRTLETRVREVEARNYVAWTDGLFRFDAMPLELLMMRLSRWFNISYEFKDDSLKKVRFTGAFRKYDNIDHILKMIGELMEISFQVEGRKVVIKRK